MGHGKNPPVKSRKHSSPAGRVAFADMRFVRIELLESEKDEFRALLDSGEFETVSIDNFIERGYKVTYTRDTRGGGALCTVSAGDADHPNAGLMLTGRGRDATVALAVVAFKDIYLCPDGLWRAAEDSRGGSYSDIG